MKAVCYLAVPFIKEDVTLAIESGIDTLIVPDETLEQAQNLARCDVLPASQTAFITLNSKADEEKALEYLTRGMLTVLEHGWEIIPVENLLAREEKMKENNARLALEVRNDQEARLAIKILERGADLLVVGQNGLPALQSIIRAVKEEAASLTLEEAVITEITPVGMGHRVCVDTLSLFHTGQGMLVGNSAAFTFLVNAETEQNEYVASRPFRVNAGAVHSYCMGPDDTTAYLEELRAGHEVLIVDHTGGATTAIVGRAKIERRPMLHIKAQSGASEGSIFLQNAETIRLVTPGGKPVSVVDLRAGDSILCHLDTAGRHFGMRISEDISED